MGSIISSKKLPSTTQPQDAVVKGEEVFCKQGQRSEKVMEVANSSLLFLQERKLNVPFVFHCRRKGPSRNLIELMKV